jgi:hypothetical protein
MLPTTIPTQVLLFDKIGIAGCVNSVVPTTHFGADGTPRHTIITTLPLARRATIVIVSVAWSRRVLRASGVFERHSVLTLNFYMLLKYSIFWKGSYRLFLGRPFIIGTLLLYNY